MPFLPRYRLNVQSNSYPDLLQLSSHGMQRSAQQQQTTTVSKNVESSLLLIIQRVYSIRSKIIRMRCKLPSMIALLLLINLRIGSRTVSSPNSLSSGYLTQAELIGITEAISSVTEDIFNGPTNTTHDEKDVAVASNVVWSPCGAPVPLDLTFQLRVKTRENADNTASGSISSAGVYNTWLAWKPC
jgi:hypothetical protein